MKENAKLKQDIVQLENSVTERLGYLQRYKETAAYKISSLQSKMSSTVPLEELDKANKFQEEMSMKYAQLLHHQEANIISSHTINQLQVCYYGDTFIRHAEIFAKEYFHKLSNLLDVFIVCFLDVL